MKKAHAVRTVHAIQPEQTSLSQNGFHRPMGMDVAGEGTADALMPRKNSCTDDVSENETRRP